MAKGERRYKPPAGYITATQALKLLGKTLYDHVKEGKVRKLSPPGHKQGFYNESDVLQILEHERKFAEYVPGQWRQRITSVFERAAEEDIPTVVDIDARTFKEEGPAASLEVCLSWWHKNPDTFYVLRYQGRIVGYASALPLSKDMIGRFVRDEISGEEITPDDILTYEPGRTYSLYVMSVAIDPDLAAKEKHKYGAAITRGIGRLLLNYANQGIEISTITARSYKPDGLHMLTGMGIPWLRSPVPHKNLFSVTLAESGFPMFVKYSEQLAQWKSTHQRITPEPAQPDPPAPLPQRRRKAPEAPPNGLQEALPEGWVDTTSFADEHGVMVTEVVKAISQKAFKEETGAWKEGTAVIKSALSPTEQRRFCVHFAIKRMLQKCENHSCVCHTIRSS